MNEKNEGYGIIESEVYLTEDDGRRNRITLGRKVTKLGERWISEYVTWDGTAYPAESGRKSEFYWGHYFSSELEARADYHRRLLEKYERRIASC